MIVKTNEPKALAKRMFFLAYKAAHVVGMARDGVTEDHVWDSVTKSWDGTPCKPYGDYVFGRMMKTTVKIDATSVRFRDGNLDREYQSWADRYPTYLALCEAAAKELGIAIAPCESEAA